MMPVLGLMFTAPDEPRGGGLTNVHSVVCILRAPLALEGVVHSFLPAACAASLSLAPCLTWHTACPGTGLLLVRVGGHEGLDQLASCLLSHPDGDLAVVQSLLYVFTEFTVWCCCHKYHSFWLDTPRVGLVPGLLLEHLLSLSL